MQGTQTERPWEPSPELGRQTRVPEPVQAHNQHPRPRPAPTHTPPLLDQVGPLGAQTRLRRQAAQPLPAPFPPHRVGSRAARAAPTPGPARAPTRPSLDWARHSGLPADRQGRVSAAWAAVGSAGPRPSPQGPGAATRGSPTPEAGCRRPTGRSRPCAPRPLGTPPRLPPGPLSAPSRPDPAARRRAPALLPCGKPGALGQARGLSWRCGPAAGNARRLIPAHSGREGGREEEERSEQLQNPGGIRCAGAGARDPRSPWSLRVLCLSWAPLPGTLGGSRSLRRSFGGRSGHSPKNGQEAGRGGGGGQWD